MIAIPKSVKWMMLALIAGVFLLGPIGCTKYAKEQDLQALEQQRQATLSAEQELAQKQSETQSLENQLQQKQDELAELKEERDIVAQRVQE